MGMSLPNAHIPIPSCPFEMLLLDPIVIIMATHPDGVSNTNGAEP